MHADHITVPQNIQQLLTLARSPGAVRDALVASRATLDLRGVADLAKAHGIEVSVEQLESFAKSLPVPTELTDEELDGVTGGVRGLLGELMRFISGGGFSTDNGGGTPGGGGG